MKDVQEANRMCRVSRLCDGRFPFVGAAAAFAVLITLTAVV